MLNAQGSTTGWLEQFRVVPPGKVGEPRGRCDRCGDFIWSGGAYRIPGLSGLYCEVLCIEAKLFGLNHCRWCGATMDKPYLSIASRLCSLDCETNYYAHVLGDHSAELGTGHRFILWLERRQPAVYRSLFAVGVKKQAQGGSDRRKDAAEYAKERVHVGVERFFRGEKGVLVSSAMSKDPVLKTQPLTR